MQLQWGLGKYSVDHGWHATAVDAIDLAPFNGVKQVDIKLINVAIDLGKMLIGDKLKMT